MKKVMLYIAAFLMLCAYIFSIQYVERGKQIKLLESEKSELMAKVKSMEGEIEKYNQKQMEASNTIEKVREVVRTVKEPCNCYHTVLPDGVVKLLHDNNK